MAGWALLPLRIFLGVTFVFAGLQKLANPGFFDASNPTSIQSQLASAARVSPIHALVAHLQHAAVPLGVVIALGELAVGSATLAGLWSRAAAVGGMLLSFSLFLTVSFHASPYYTGSDIVFVFAWTPLLVAGAGGVLSLDAMARDMARRRAAGGSAAPAPGAIDRRTFSLQGLFAAALAGVALAGAGLAAGLGRLGGKSNSTVTPVLSPSTTTTAGPSTTTTGATTSGSSAPSTTAVTDPPGTRIASASSVPVGGSETFQDPKSGSPSVVVQPEAGTFAAFDAVCPHEGCIVAFSASAKRFICPCHGSQFNGATGALLNGPATRGLTRIPVKEGPDGGLFVT
jgi:thiosulfate dehydrogenase [quinone] large subunit